VTPARAPSGKGRASASTLANILRACYQCGRAHGFLRLYRPGHGLTPYFAHEECDARAEEAARRELAWEDETHEPVRTVLAESARGIYPVT